MGLLSFTRAPHEDLAVSFFLLGAPGLLYLSHWGERNLLTLLFIHLVTSPTIQTAFHLTYHLGMFFIFCLIHFATTWSWYQAAGRFLILRYFYGFLILMSDKVAGIYGVASRQVADIRSSYHGLMS